MSENDVKIYIGKKEMNKSSGELSNAFDAVITNRSNGNIDKAKQLGAALALLAPTGDSPMSLKLEEHIPQKFLAPDILYQIRVLLIFAAETLLQIEVPVALLSTTAITTMYGEIEKTSPAFYDNIANGAAFTFYYLALQKGANAADSVADTFAMLCGVKNKEGFVLIGKQIWNIAVAMIEKEIDKADFKNI